MSLVLDSSMTLAWLHDDERDAATAAVFDRVIEKGAVVPSLWLPEVANSLTVSLRRGRINAETRTAFLANLAELDITVDETGRDLCWGPVVALADAHGLTVYDAVYLELAQRRRAPLASLDAALLRAAKAAGVETA